MSIPTTEKSIGLNSVSVPIMSAVPKATTAIEPKRAKEAITIIKKPNPPVRAIFL